MFDRKRRAVAVSASLLIAFGVVAGCSSDSDGQPDSSATPSASASTSAGTAPAPTSAGSPEAPPDPEIAVEVQGNITLTGAETVDGDFSNDTWTVQPSCQDAAANGSGGAGFGPDGAFLIPGPYADGTVLSDGTNYISNLQIEPDKYQGPGSYTQIAAGIQVGGEESGYYYDFSLAGTSEAIVDADGSGSLEFTAVPAATAPAQMISGKITWTCGGS